eukprot:scaffold32207_cov23-Cyclotella_meneghiniana.AAC.3
MVHQSCLCHAGLGGRESRLVYCKQMTPGSCNDHQRTLTSVRVKELHCRIVFWSRMAWVGLLLAGGDSILWFSAEFFGSRMNSYSREAKQTFAEMCERCHAQLCVVLTRWFARTFVSRLHQQVTSERQLDETQRSKCRSALTIVFSAPAGDIREASTD